MSHASGTGKGTSKRGASNAQVPLQNTKVGDNTTDRTRWRLKDDRGCQTWHYLESDEEAWPQSTADKYFLGLDTVRPRRNPLKPPNE
jgi:lanosterol synthase